MIQLIIWNLPTVKDRFYLHANARVGIQTKEDQMADQENCLVHLFSLIAH